MKRSFGLVLMLAVLAACGDVGTPMDVLMESQTKQRVGTSSARSQIRSHLEQKFAKTHRVDFIKLLPTGQASVFAFRATLLDRTSDLPVVVSGRFHAQSGYVQLLGH